MTDVAKVPENLFKFNISGETPLVRAEWKVPADLPYLEGHFPSMPIVPGVALIEASLALLSQTVGRSRLRSVKQAKFMMPLAPGEEVAIEARRHPAHENEWAVDWKKNDGSFVVRLSLALG